jgi:hypothetical protein
MNPTSLIRRFFAKNPKCRLLGHSWKQMGDLRLECERCPKVMEYKV